MSRYFDKPFAMAGDKAAVPNNTQIDGSVSYETGYGFDYERDPDPLIDPLTKDIERDKMNQILFDITSTLKQLQESGGAPEWYPSLASSIGYPRGANAFYVSKVWESTVPANASTPGSSPTWVEVTPLDPTLQAMVGQNPITNQMIYFTALNTAAKTALTSFGRSLIGAADLAGGRTVLGIVGATEGAPGLVRLATLAETIGGTPGLAVQPNRLKEGATRFGTPASGGAYLPFWLDGMQERWGTVSVPGNSTISVTGLYNNACQVVMVCLGFESTADFQPPKAVPSGTGIRISNSDSNALVIRYFTKGY